MANPQDLAEFNRKAKGKYKAPVPPPPKLPLDIAEGSPEQRRRRVENYNKEMDEWRKKLLD